jgi:hypothetical protein
VQQGITDGSFVAQDAPVTSAALVGMLGESLVGPLSPMQGEVVIGADEQTTLINALKKIVLRAVGSAANAE